MNCDIYYIIIIVDNSYYIHVLIFISFFSLLFSSVHVCCMVYVVSIPFDIITIILISWN